MGRQGAKIIKLEPSKVAFLLIDVQEKLASKVENAEEILFNLQKAIKGLSILGISVYVSEQYPSGLGETVVSLKKLLCPDQKYFSKTTFSCFDSMELREKLLQPSIEQWIVAGLEAHVCVLQTAKDLVLAGKEVVVLNDCISSRSASNLLIAIAEMRECGIRVSSLETILFELIKDSKAPQFKQISQWVKDANPFD